MWQLSVQNLKKSNVKVTGRQKSKANAAYLEYHNLRCDNLLSTPETPGN